MFKEALQKILAYCWYYFFEYFKTYLFPKIKEAFAEAKDKFIESLWEKVKDDVHAHVEHVVQHVNEYVKSDSYEEYEKAVIDTLFKKVNLPLPLKPFKPLIKSIFKKKVRALISDNLKKLDTIV